MLIRIIHPVDIGDIADEVKEDLDVVEDGGGIMVCLSSRDPVHKTISAQEQNEDTGLHTQTLTVTECHVQPTRLRKSELRMD